jgi:hypothetical protein
VIVEISCETGIAYEELVSLDGGVLETYIDVMRERSKKR